MHLNVLAISNEKGFLLKYFVKAEHRECSKHYLVMFMLIIVYINLNNIKNSFINAVDKIVKPIIFMFKNIN